MKQRRTLRSGVGVGFHQLYTEEAETAAQAQEEEGAARVVRLFDASMLEGRVHDR